MKKGLARDAQREEIEGMMVLISESVSNDDENCSETTMIRKKNEVSWLRVRDERIEDLVSEIESLKSIASEKDELVEKLWDDLFAAEEICREREERIRELRDALEIATLERTEALRALDIYRREKSNNERIVDEDYYSLETRVEKMRDEEERHSRVREECVDSIVEVQRRLSAIEEALTNGVKERTVEEKKSIIQFWSTLAVFAITFLSLFFTKTNPSL